MDHEKGEPHNSKKKINSRLLCLSENSPSVRTTGASS